MRPLFVVAALLVVACGTAAPPGTARTESRAPVEAPPSARLACPAGRGDCDADPSNGCEVDLSDDADNCRACGHACSAAGAATAMCIDGRCAEPARRDR
jgi:hypothetical protein